MDIVLNKFIQHNPDLKAAQAAAQRHSEQAKIETLWPNPSLEFEQERTDEFSQQFIIISQTIRNPVEYNLRIKSAKSQEDAAFAAYREQAGELYFRLRTLYVNASAKQQRLALLTRISEVVRQAHEAAKIRTEGGDLGSFELNRLSTAVATFEDELAQVQVEANTALRELIAFISDRKQTSVYDTSFFKSIILDTMRYVPPKMDLDTIQNHAYHERGMLIFARSATRADTFAVRAEKAARFPEFSIRGGITGEPNLQTSPSPYIGFGIDIPLWNFRGVQIRAAEAALQESQAFLAIAHREVDLDIFSTFEQVQNYSRRIEKISYELLKNNERLLSDALYLYSEGELSLIELLDGISAAKETKLLQIELLRNYNISRFKLDQARGFLPESLKLTN
jgi:cobalt-zinc-cadmium efflux system outer membrane protein